LDVLTQGANYYDDGFIAEIHNPAKVWVGMSNIQFWTAAQMAEFYTCDIK
jgi:hypothetical protein